ncbi:Scr1 family TA system antitoxin-like transcriptional regulator [Streptomyces sp. NPDC059816]|uniref:helix-turn-helix domain-containing protein n=1 Tax=Streptomyces sp. NPDC059816 TaxID=3346960 RepID=UPI00366A2E7F
MFGEVLRHFRQTAGLTQDDLAARVPCDRSLVARVETGTRVPQDDFARTCDTVLGTKGVLFELWGRIDWYESVEHPDWFKRRADMDATATVLYEYQTQVIPGLLQTEPYIRSLYEHTMAGDLLEENVRARLSRQQRYFTTGGPFYLVILNESCLYTAVGSAQVMRGQCARLLSAGRLPNICVQVVPSDYTGFLRPKTSMSLITLPNGERWAYSESMERGHFECDPAVLERQSRLYDVLRANALSASDSAALISDALEGHGHHEQAWAPRYNVGEEQPQRLRRRKLPRNRLRYPRLRPDR